MSKKIYKVSEFAEAIGVSKKTLQRWDDDKKLIAFRNPINGYRFYTHDQLIEYMNASSSKASIKEAENDIQNGYLCPHCAHPLVKCEDGSIECTECDYIK